MANKFKTIVLGGLMSVFSIASQAQTSNPVWAERAPKLYSLNPDLVYDSNFATGASNNIRYKVLSTDPAVLAYYTETYTDKFLDNGIVGPSCVRSELVIERGDARVAYVYDRAASCTLQAFHSRKNKTTGTWDTVQSHSIVPASGMVEDYFPRMEQAIKIAAHGRKEGFDALIKSIDSRDNRKNDATSPWLQALTDKVAARKPLQSPYI